VTAFEGCYEFSTCFVEGGITMIPLFVSEVFLAVISVLLGKSGGSSDEWAVTQAKNHRRSI
jgi:hypothetical protein